MTDKVQTKVRLPFYNFLNRPSHCYDVLGEEGIQFLGLLLYVILKNFFVRMSFDEMKVLYRFSNPICCNGVVRQKSSIIESLLIQLSDLT
jgi:hypothetical protein